MRAVYPSSKAHRRQAAAVLGCVLAVGGCYFGAGTRSYEPARSVHGRTARIETLRDGGPGITVRGELLAVTDGGVLVRGERGALIAVPHPQIHWLRIDGRSTNVMGVELSHSPESRYQVRRFARFPYGIRDATLDTLLAAAGQTTVLAPGDPGTLPGIAARLRAVTNQGYEVSLRGELLAVEASALVLASRARGVVRVAYACLTLAAFDDFETPVGLGERRALGDADRAALARRARFPQGMGPNELKRVLPAGSTAPVEVRCN
jgi:hypothetical protein